MPTRSYYFPDDFQHLERILFEEYGNKCEDELSFYRKRRIPPIPNTGIFPIFMGISPKIIFSILKRPEKYYRSFSIQKKDKTKRSIDTPRTYLKVIQWWILDNILNHIDVAPNVFGFVRGRNVFQNAEFHLGAKHILNVDIKQFFPSITNEQVKNIFSSAGYKEDVADMLTCLCCYKGRVPQGAPTSPALANLVLRQLDKSLSSIAEENNFKYSRYADDLTFSSLEQINVNFLNDVKEIIEREGFNLKPEKTRFAGSGGRMEITGIVINKKMQPSRIWRKRTRATLHQFKYKTRLTRRDISYLFGIKGVTKQFSDSPQMQFFLKEADNIIQEKSKTIIGRSNNPILPHGLTLCQAQVLVELRPQTKNIEIAKRLNISEAAVKKRLQEAFKKIGVTSRRDAEIWAKSHL